jgi:hypothetical protein
MTLADDDPSDRAGVRVLPEVLLLAVCDDDGLLVFSESYGPVAGWWQMVE